MQHIILQPCSNQMARNNYERTIVNYIPLTSIQAYLTDDQKAVVTNSCPDGKLHIWGVVNGDNNRIYQQWQRIKIGDIVLFAWNNALRGRAVVTGTFQNENLSRHLWEDKSYHNIYLLSEIQNIDIPYAEFNRIVGYNSNNIVQGFQVLDDQKSGALLEQLDIGETTYCEEISEDSYFEAIESLKGAETLDIAVVVMQRKEQAFLRQQLFGKAAEGRCAICGKKYPVNLLTAAHIKRRADCTNDERKDVHNIVMPACRFGCDDLYEKGYLLVDDGKIIANDNMWLSSSAADYVAQLVNNQCTVWNENTKKYFDAHNKRFVK